MKWLLIVLVILVSPAFVAYSGTFREDFSDGNLDGWHFTGLPRPVESLVKIKNGHLAIDTRIGKHDNNLPLGLNFIKVVSMELRTDNSETWDSYTLTCRIRFAELQMNGIFGIGVRRNEGHFGEMAEHEMLVLPIRQYVQVTSVPPDFKFDRETGRGEGRIHRKLLKPKHLRRPIKQKRWLPIKIVAEEDNFEFHFDDNFVTQYEDKTAVPGFVRFQADTGMLVYLDDVAITGPEIPDIGGPHSETPEAHLATTWGKIKQPRR